MIKGESQVSRKTVNEDRIAICPQFGCKHLEKVKPLKFGFLGFRKYPKCSKHKIHLIFVDEFIGDFLHAVNACLFDLSSLPPENLRSVIKKKTPNELITFINGWMYCNPIGRGAQIVSQYMDGLSRGYMRLLSWKQRKALKNEKSSNKRYNMLRLGLKKIANEYTTFLQELREKSEMLYDPENLHTLSKDIQKLLKTWLKDHLKTIKSVNCIEKSKSTIQDDFLPVFKEEYDKILHAGTCALLLGKSPSIVTKAVSAFELFSAYHEFLKAGLCKKLKKGDIKSLLKGTQELLNDDEENLLNNQENEKKDFFNELDNMKDEIEEELLRVPNINVLNFRQKVKNHLEALHALINGTEKQKSIIKSKSLEILDELISRAKSNEFIIPKHANPERFAATITYTVIITNEDMPKISMKQIERLINVPHGPIGKLYKRYFKNIYQRKEFLSSLYGLKNIRQVISQYFFELMKGTEIETSKLVSILRENIQKNINLPDQLTQRDINTLREMATYYPDTFIKYFSDLVEVVKQLVTSSDFYKKIGAPLMIKPLVKFLEGNGINLLHTFIPFYNSVREIFNFLKNSKYSKFFPAYADFPEDLSKKKRGMIPKIIGTKIKIYVMKNIYNGKYFKDGVVKCPECLKEGLILNTDITRTDALQFHHASEEKENKFTANNLYRKFTANRANSHFLEDLVRLMESEGVILLCRNHHEVLHDEYYNYFKYLINWENIFSLPAEMIHILIVISVDNFHKTKSLPYKSKNYIKSRIVKKLKKRYIIEYFYGEICHTCEEFSTKEHLPAFHYHHKDDRIKSCNASDLYDTNSCSEIVRILSQEKGGYICANCHTVISYKYIHLINKIYENKNDVKRILDDYNNVLEKFTLIHKIEGIRTPLRKKSSHFNERGFVRYLDAVYELINSGREATTPALMNYMGLNDSSIFGFFRRWKSGLFNQYVKITAGKSRIPHKYILTDIGETSISLIHHFRDYYSSII